ncbi:MAG: hypothetical protein HKN54_09170 [Flavobacteriaceae bacterium]|nr:hypothetical protein [Flavobacteriaceae bacterium]
MRPLVLAVLCLSFMFLSCDDGDIITVNLDFDQQLDRCGDLNSENYVIYDIRTDPNESLTLLFPGSSTYDAIFDPVTSPTEGSFVINNSTIRFNYRKYDGDPNGLICEDIPSSTVMITQDYEATNGTVNYSSSFIDDDEDDIPSELEDINGNGDLEDDDTDGDGIPNYKDNDDDGDNVLTKDENPDPDGDGDLSDAQNTDGTDEPDYLDTDDDNDGVLTRNEDENDDGNLFNDFAPGAISPRFVDDMATDVFVGTVVNENSFTRTVTVEFSILNVDIEILSADVLELGTFEIEL